MSGSIAISRIATGWRWAEIRHGDTLQRIAARELSDAARWHDLASLNDLLPPYLTGDTAEALASRGRVLLYGQQIRVFAPSAVADASVEAGALYGTDAALDAHGMLGAADGDLATISGLPNLAAALSRRITTERGELLFHSDYGSMVRQVLGTTNGPARGAFTARAAREAVERDNRVSRVTAATAAPEGDRIAITLVVEPIGAGTPLSLRTEV